MCYTGKAYIKDNTKDKICNDKKIIQMINNTINYLSSSNRLADDNTPKLVSLLMFDDENYAVLVEDQEEDDTRYKCTINAYFDSSNELEGTFYHKAIEFDFKK